MLSKAALEVNLTSNTGRLPGCCSLDTANTNLQAALVDKPTTFEGPIDVLMLSSASCKHELAVTVECGTGWEPRLTCRTLFILQTSSTSTADQQGQTPLCKG